MGSLKAPSLVPAIMYALRPTFSMPLLTAISGPTATRAKWRMCWLFKAKWRVPSPTRSAPNSRASDKSPARLRVASTPRPIGLTWKAGITLTGLPRMDSKGRSEFAPVDRSRCHLCTCLYRDGQSLHRAGRDWCSTCNRGVSACQGRGIESCGTGRWPGRGTFESGIGQAGL